MIYLIYGGDKDKARAKANELVQSLLKKKPDASFFKMSAGEWSAATLAEYIGSQGLFEQKYIVLFDGVFENKEAKETITGVGNLKEMKESPHVFIFREDELDKATLVKFEKNAVKVQKCALKTMTGLSANKKKEFSIFTLADALGRRDRKGLWVFYQQAKKAGLEDEQIHGTLFWQMKSIIVAKVAANAGEAKLNPFVFGKAKSFASNFSDDELAGVSHNLICLYHDSRRGVHDLDVALERFILTI